MQQIVQNILKTGFTVIVIMLYMINGKTQKAGSDSLAYYLETAVQNNPALKASFNDYLAALEKAPQASALPDPEVSSGFFIKPMELITGNQVADIRLMQMFPWFGTLNAAKDEASLMAKARYESFRNVRDDLFYMVRTSWYESYKVTKEIKLLEHNLNILNSLQDLINTRYQYPEGSAVSSSMQRNVSTTGNTDNTGSMVSENSMNSGSMTGMANTGQSTSSMQGGMSNTMVSATMDYGNRLTDLLRVKMEILELKNDLALLHDRQKTLQARFNALLNRNLYEEVYMPDTIIKLDLHINEMALADSILKNNPMLAMLEAEKQSLEAKERMAEKMGYPMVGIGLDYMLINKREENTSMMNGKDMVMPMVSLTIPVYRKKYKAMKKEADLLTESVAQRLSDMQNNLLVQHRDLSEKLADSGRRINLYTEQVKLAESSTGLLIQEFTVSGTGYEEVLRMQLRLLDYEFKLVEAVVDYNSAVALTEKLMSADLKMNLSLKSNLIYDK